MKKIAYKRNVSDAVLAASCFLLLIAMSAIVHRDNPPEWEIEVFRFFNHMPDFLFPLLWPFMQYGVFVTIPIVSLVALRAKKIRLFGLLLLGGIGIYFIARYVKEIVPRGRPGVLIDDAIERENFAPWSAGFTSGHTAVASTIATFAHYYLSRNWRIFSAVTLAVVVIGRMYVGAHLPLDVLGGVTLGVGVASLINFAVGVPESREKFVEERS